MLLALILSVVMNLGTYWYSDKIVLKMYHAKEVTSAESPELYAIVQRLVTRANIPMPKVYVVNTSMPNAFATGRDPSHGAVAVTTGIMRILDRDELEGVIAHELSHVKNRDTLIRAGVNPSTAHMFIVNPLRASSITSLFSTHPSTEERVKRLMAMR